MPHPAPDGRVVALFDLGLIVLAVECAAALSRSHSLGTPMKISYLCTNSYADAAVLRAASFPYPPGLYDPEVGTRSVQGALANARLADELGFDWVSVSEHHYAPGIMSPNALV